MPPGAPQQIGSGRILLEHPPPTRSHAGAWAATVVGFVLAVLLAGLIAMVLPTGHGETSVARPAPKSPEASAAALLAAVPALSGEVRSGTGRAADRLLPFLAAHRGAAVRLDVLVDPVGVVGPGYHGSVTWTYTGCAGCGASLRTTRDQAGGSGILALDGRAWVRGWFLVGKVRASATDAVATLTPLTQQAAERAVRR